MRLIVVGSGSSGNSYILSNEHEILVLECGISYKEIIKHIDYKPNRILSCLITHEHG